MNEIVLYCRKSIDTQESDEQSLELRRRASSQGRTVVSENVYVETGARCRRRPDDLYEDALRRRQRCGISPCSLCP